MATGSGFETNTTALNDDELGMVAVAHKKFQGSFVDIIRSGLFPGRGSNRIKNAYYRKIGG